MRIVVYDPYLGKFFQDTVNAWKAQGHEVEYIRYYDPAFVKWADVVWFETCDNNLKVASTGEIQGVKHDGWALSEMDLTGKKIIVRVIDIEAWYGHHNGADWERVTDVIFLAPHIKRLVEKDVKLPKTHIIPCGVDIDKFKPGRHQKTGNKIAWVCERWPTKGIDYALQIMAALPDHYELHALGRWNDRYAWEQAYQEDFIRHHDIKYFETEWVDDVAKWYRNKDFILSTSKKEAFGYSIAEGMATGLQPVIHHFYGAEDIWPGITWSTIEEAVETILDGEMVPDPRQYLIDRGYSLEQMLNKFQEVIDG